MQVSDLFDDRQPKAGSARARLIGRVGWGSPKEALPNTRLIRCGDSFAVVLDKQHPTRLAAFDADRNRSAGRRMTYRVVEQICKHFPEQQWITGRCGLHFSAIYAEIDALCSRIRQTILYDP